MFWTCPACIENRTLSNWLNANFVFYLPCIIHQIVGTFLFFGFQILASIFLFFFSLDIPSLDCVWKYGIFLILELRSVTVSILFHFDFGFSCYEYSIVVWELTNLRVQPLSIVVACNNINPSMTALFDFTSICLVFDILDIYVRRRIFLLLQKSLVVFFLSFPFALSLLPSLSIYAVMNVCHDWEFISLVGWIWFVRWANHRIDYVLFVRLDIINLGLFLFWKEDKLIFFSLHHAKAKDDGCEYLLWNINCVRP